MHLKYNNRLLENYKKNRFMQLLIKFCCFVFFFFLFLIPFTMWQKICYKKYFSTYLTVFSFELTFYKATLNTKFHFHPSRIKLELITLIMWFRRVSTKDLRKLGFFLFDKTYIFHSFIKVTNSHVNTT